MASLRVLYFQTDPLTAQVRLLPLLDRLRGTGDIAGYAVVDRDLAATGDRFERYDVLLTHRNPSTRQAAWLGRHTVPLAYDIDDLILQPPDTPVGRRQAAEQAAIRLCLTQAQRVSGPSPRLLAMLAGRVPGGLGRRGVLLPNAGVETPPADKPPGRPRLLWVASSLPPAGGERDGVCRGIVAAAAAIGTDILLLGRFPPDLRAAFPRHEAIPFLPHADYRRLLADGPFVAVAPLPSDLSGEQQAFVDCKSDIKAAEYGSSRVAAAYAPAPPYAESDLPCTLVPANTPAAWEEVVGRLADDYPDEGNRLGEHPAFVARRPSVLAQRLLDILVDVRDAGSGPFAFAAQPTPAIFRRLEQGLRTVRARILGKAN